MFRVKWVPSRCLGVGPEGQVSCLLTLHLHIEGGEDEARQPSPPPPPPVPGSRLEWLLWVRGTLGKSEFHSVQEASFLPHLWGGPREPQQGWGEPSL